MNSLAGLPWFNKRQSTTARGYCFYLFRLVVIKRLGKCVRSVVKVFFYCTDYVEIFRENGLWAAFSQCHKPVAKLNTTIIFNSSILSSVLDAIPVAKTNKKTKLNVIYVTTRGQLIQWLPSYTTGLNIVHLTTYYRHGR